MTLFLWGLKEVEERGGGTPGVTESDEERDPRQEPGKEKREKSTKVEPTSKKRKKFFKIDQI